MITRIEKSQIWKLTMESTNMKTNHGIPKYENQPWNLQIWKPTMEPTNMKTNHGIYNYEN